MLTVGRILKEARLKSGITFEEAEKATKIRRKYLVALEKNEFSQLPGRAYIAGFIRNYSDFLKLNPEPVLAIFRREYTDNQKAGVLPKGFTQPLSSSSFSLTPKIAAITASLFLLTVFFIYLFIEYRFVALPPHLSLDNPLDGQRVNSKSITFVGQSDPDAQVTINHQPVTLQVDGSFSIDVSLTPGINTISVISTNKFGKKTQISRMIEYTAQP